MYQLEFQWLSYRSSSYLEPQENVSYLEKNIFRPVSSRKKKKNRKEAVFTNKIHLYFRGWDIYSYFALCNTC